jgi:methionine-rich copper-binding protein CopC
VLFRFSAPAAVAVLLAWSVMVPRVSAHAGYAGSSPTVDAVLTSAPTEVWVQFSEAVTASSLLTVTDAAGNRVDRGDSRLDPANPQRLWVSLHPLGPGRYTVHYTVTSREDGHTSTDSFGFTVAGMPSQPAAAPTATGAAAVAPAPAAPAGAASPASGHNEQAVAEADPTRVRVLADDPAGPVHSHMRVHRHGDRLRVQVPVTNHLHGPINSLEVHIVPPHGTQYLGSATDDGDVAQWDGAVARYYVPFLGGDGRLGPYNLDLRIHQPDPHHPHPTLTTRVWLRYQHDGVWEAYTSTLVIENPLEPGGAAAPAASGGH